MNLHAEYQHYMSCITLLKLICAGLVLGLGLKLVFIHIVH